MRLLDLGNNSMGEAGAAAMTRLLAAKRSLKELNLYMNDIGDAGVSRVRAAGWGGGAAALAEGGGVCARVRQAGVCARVE